MILTGLAEWAFGAVATRFAPLDPLKKAPFGYPH